MSSAGAVCRVSSSMGAGCRARKDQEIFRQGVGKNLYFIKMPLNLGG